MAQELHAAWVVGVVMEVGYTQLMKLIEEKTNAQEKLSAYLQSIDSDLNKEQAEVLSKVAIQFMEEAGRVVMHGVSSKQMKKQWEKKLVRKKLETKNITKEGQKLIGSSGTSGATFVNKMPKDWTVKPAKKGNGTRYINPKCKEDYIRFASKNLDHRAPLGQQEPYFQRHKNGKVLTRSGEWVVPNTIDKLEYHIPQEMFEKFSHLLDF